MISSFWDWKKKKIVKDIASDSTVVGDINTGGCSTPSRLFSVLLSGHGRGSSEGKAADHGAQPELEGSSQKLLPRSALQQFYRHDVIKKEDDDFRYRLLRSVRHSGINGNLPRFDALYISLVVETTLHTIRWCALLLPVSKLPPINSISSEGRSLIYH